jgi:hypothetical protein
MRYWFVYETLLRGRRRILAKTEKTVEQMDEIIKLFPAADYVEVAEATYNYMSVGDAW